MVQLSKIKASDFDEKIVQERLLNFSKRTGYNFIQSNGQRIYTAPPTMCLPKPPKGSEVFIGRLPRTLFEDEIIPVFEQIGILYNFRLMMDFTGRNRGFAFACYTNAEDAAMAVKNLDGCEIKPTKKIGVYRSVDNCRLFAGNIPTDMTAYELKNILSEYVEGITEVIMYPDLKNELVNRGYAFIEFVDHSRAAMARRQLAPAGLEIEEKVIRIDWADPIPEVDPEVMAQVSKLYLRNVPVSITQEELLQLLEKALGRGFISRVHKSSNFAFVHFLARSYAEHAHRKLQGFVINGRPVEVEWARPVEYSRTNRMNMSANNYCTSVPPIVRRAVLENRKNIPSFSSSEMAASCSTSPVYANQSSQTVLATRTALSTYGLTSHQTPPSSESQPSSSSGSPRMDSGCSSYGSLPKSQATSRSQTMCVASFGSNCDVSSPPYKFYLSGGPVQGVGTPIRAYQNTTNPSGSYQALPKGTISHVYGAPLIKQFACVSSSVAQVAQPSQYLNARQLLGSEPYSRPLTAMTRPPPGLSLFSQPQFIRTEQPSLVSRTQYLPQTQTYQGQGVTRSPITAFDYGLSTPLNYFQG